MSVIIGMDPHKRSATIEIVDQQAAVLAAGRFGGQGRLCRDARRGPEVRGPDVGGRGLQRHQPAHRAPPRARLPERPHPAYPVSASSRSGLVITVR